MIKFKEMTRYRYTPYGEREVLSATFMPTGAPALTEFGFTGRRHDAESSGLMYFRARYYSSELGRFISRDPLLYVDRMNLYAGYFVPNHLDPFGMDLKPCPKSSKKFKKDVEKAIKEIEKSKGGKEMVDKLKKSKNTHIIKEGKGGNYITPDKGYKVGKGDSSTTYWNPSRKQGGRDDKGSRKRPPFVGLGHELGHAEAIDSGTQTLPDMKTPKTRGTTPHWEKNAMKREGQIRKDHNLTPRSSYY